MGFSPLRVLAHKTNTIGAKILEILPLSNPLHERAGPSLFRNLPKINCPHELQRHIKITLAA
jgi:hypothetical protein